MAALAALFSAAAGAREPPGLHLALTQLEQRQQFSGAVVIRDARGTSFARGYGFADPFSKRRFTPSTPVDSASLAKPVTAAAVLMLAREGRIDLDSPARRYLPDLAPGITVRHLLAHSAGLTRDESEQGIVGKSNTQLIREARGRPVSFKPGTGFSYCNLCTVALAEIVERQTQRPLIDFAHRRLSLPAGIGWRPARLSDWTGRAIGYRIGTDGQPMRADSYDGELFTGAGNLSVSAEQLADWGAAWANGRLAPIWRLVTTPARIAASSSGLTWGNWYCTAGGLRCHYLGHHEGFHHLLYWNAARRISVAMVSNNSLDPALQQRLRRALVAFAERKEAAGRAELQAGFGGRAPPVGRFRFPGGGQVRVRATPTGEGMVIERGGLNYAAYPIGGDIRYVPGLDAYLAGHGADGIHYLSLYEELRGRPAGPAASRVRRLGQRVRFVSSP